MRTNNNERGGARVKLIAFLVIFGLVVYACYLYVPIALDAYYFKDEMQKKVDLAATQGKDTAWVGEQIKKSGAEYHVPADAIIASSQNESRMEVHVQFTRPISVPGYTFDYKFDYTAKSSTYWSSK
jgi:F0F1-type ATP synthase membrane subunit b/b'